VNNYDHENLKSTLSKLGNVLHQATMEHNKLQSHLRDTNLKMTEMRERKSKKCNSSISKDTTMLEGRQISKIESIQDFWGDYNFVFFECTDGTRVVMNGKMKSNRGYGGLSSEKMEEITFFTSEEIENKKKQEKREKENRVRDEKQKKERELIRLQKELEG